MASSNIEIELVARCISEFYNSPDENTRKRSQTILEGFCIAGDSWKHALNLIDSRRPVVVQFYAANHLCDVLSNRFEELSSSIENIEFLKQFLIQKLAMEAGAMPHSVLNKLSTGLAIFILNSIPDLWSEPLVDLFNYWQNQPELLLRVLVEVAAEFPRVRLPLNQRNSVKSELQRSCKDVISFSHEVLKEPQSAASLKNAAVECVELWLKLPGIRLSDFVEIFSAVFENVSGEIVTLTRMISTIKSNDELPDLPNFIWQLAQYTVHFICPLIADELKAILGGSTEDANNNGGNFSEINPLICTVVEFLAETMGKIFQLASKSNSTDSTNVLINLCAFFQSISNIPYQYPTQELVSDIPEHFWTALSVEISYTINENGQNGSPFERELIKFFLGLLRPAIEKIAYPSNSAFLFNKEELEKFDAYRLSRSEVIMNAVKIAPQETLALVSTTLNEFLMQHDIQKSEAALFLLAQTVDFLNAEQMQLLVPCLEKCNPMNAWGSVCLEDFQRFSESFLKFLQKTEHLLVAMENPEQRLLSLAKVVVSYLDAPSLQHSVHDRAFETIIALLKHKNEALKLVADFIAPHCYNYFTNEKNAPKSRLMAIRCVGLTFNYKTSEFILEGLDHVLSPRMIHLNQLLDDKNFALSHDAILFELSIIAQMLSDLDGGISEIPLAHPPSHLIMEKSMPMLNSLVQKPNLAKELVDKVCELLKASVISLDANIASFLSAYLAYIDSILFQHCFSACELTKSILLAVQRVPAVAMDSGLVEKLAKWYSSHLSLALNSPDIDTIAARDEHLLDLAYHIAKKSWPLLESIISASSQEEANQVSCFLQSVSRMIARIIQSSKDVSLVRDAVRALSLITKNCLFSDKPAFAEAVRGQHAEAILSAVFTGIHSEVASQNIAQMADILYYYHTFFPAETRQLIQQLPGGDSQIVAAMFSASPSSIKTFRLHTAQIHKAFLKH